MSKKYVYCVSQLQDGVTTGRVVLTKKQAKIVDMVSKGNWLGKHEERYSGRFHIDLDSAVEASEEEIAEWEELNK